MTTTSSWHRLRERCCRRGRRRSPEGLLLLEYIVESAIDGTHLRGLQRALLVHGREAGSEQHCVLLAQRHTECGSQMQHHATARAAAARFQKTQMLLRQPAEQRELELARTACAAPLTQDASERSGWAYLRRFG